MGNFKIREFRKAKGLFQEEMAQIVGLTQSNLSRYETNDIDLTDEMIDKLRKTYGDAEVNAYLNDEKLTKYLQFSEQRENIDISGLISVIRDQNETIRKQSEVQNQTSKQLASLSERLIALLEKVSFE